MYSRQITINPATTKPDYQIRVDLNTSNFDYSKVRSDGGDIRFYDIINNPLSYYIEQWDLSGISIIWVKVPATGTGTIIIKYGDVVLSSQSDGNATFILFDQFDGSIIDTSKWVVSGTVTVGTSEAVVGSSSRLTSSNVYGQKLVRFYGKLTRSAGNASIGGLYDWGDDSQTNFRMESASVHIARVRTGGVSGIRTDISIPDYNTLYKLYELSFTPGIESDFYVNELYVGSVVNSVSTPVPNINMPVNFLAYAGAETRVDWVHVREYDSISSRVISVGSELGETGYISCATIPPGASTYLDGVLQTGITPVIITGVSVGIHTVVFRLSGYQDCTVSDVNVTDGSTTPVSCTLTVISVMRSRQITISPVTSIPNYQIRIDLNTSNFDYSKVKSDGGDIGFYDIINNPLSYYIEQWNPFGSSIIWVKVPTTGTGTITMKYGDTTLLSASDPNATFVLFDHFNDGVLDLTKWYIFGAYLESGTEIVMQGTPTNSSRLWSRDKHGISAVRFFAKMNHSDQADAASGGYYEWSNDAQAGFHFEWSAPDKHVARVRNTVIPQIATSVTVSDMNNIYAVYDVLFSPGDHAKFYINDVLEATILNSITTPIPVTNIPVQYLIYGTSITAIVPTGVTIDWIHVRNYDGIYHLITVMSESGCLPLTCTLVIVV